MFSKTKYPLAMCLLTFVAIVIVVIENLYHEPIYALFGNIDRHSFIMALITIMTFILISKLPSFKNKSINFISDKMYGVYLFRAAQIMPIFDLDRAMVEKKIHRLIAFFVLGILIMF